MANGKAGRPKKEIDKQIFEELLRIQCTEKECCRVLGVGLTRLKEWVKEEYEGQRYEEVAEQYKEEGKVNLRRMLFKQAEKQPGVAIFLAKNLLGMSDEPVAIQSGSERKEFAAAIKVASRSLSKVPVAELAEVPPAEGGGDGEEE